MTRSHSGYLKAALALAIATIFYNIMEGAVSLYFGIADESLSLAGFGADSLIEVISGTGILVMVIRLRTRGEEKRSRYEKQALRITGTSFLALAAALVFSAGYNLYTGHTPESTFWGVVVAVASVAVMIVMYRLKLYAGRGLGSDAIIADAHCTRVCIYMSLVLLAASALYELTGFAWADILGTLGLAWFSYSEGKESFEKARTGASCTCGHN